MKGRKTLDLIVGLFCLLAALIMFWETLLLGVNTRTFLAVILLASSIVLLRRWYLGEAV